MNRILFWVFATLWARWRLTYLKKVFAVNKRNPLASRSPYVIIVSKHSNYAENNCEKIMYGKITTFLGQKFELNGLTIGSPWVWWKVICQMALFPCELTPFCFWLSKNAPRTLCSTVSKKKARMGLANSCQMTWWLSFWNGSNYSFLRDFNTIYSSCRIYTGKLQQLKSFTHLSCLFIFQIR